MWFSLHWAGLARVLRDVGPQETVTAQGLVYFRGKAWEGKIMKGWGPVGWKSSLTLSGGEEGGLG